MPRGEQGHHPRPFRAHTYLGPDTVCRSEAEELWRDGGGERQEGSVQEPGLAGGCELQLLLGPRAQPPYTPRERRLRVGGQPAPFPGLLPAPCQHSAEGQSRSGAGSQAACGWEAALPPAPPAPSPAMPTHPRRLSVCPVPPFLRAPRFAHTLLCYLPSVTPLAHQPLNTHFLGLWFCTYTLFAHWYPLPRFMLGSLSWHTPSHVNTLICTFMICPPPQFWSKDLSLHISALCASTLLHTPCSLVFLSLYPPNYGSTLICTLKHAVYSGLDFQVSPRAHFPPALGHAVHPLTLSRLPNSLSPPSPTVPHRAL